MRKITVLMMSIGSLALVNCEKNDPVCYLGAPEFTVNGQPSSDGTVTLSLLENQGIMLSAGDLEGYTYQWNGPNGFQSNAANPVVDDATNADSGTYTLTLSKGICKGTSSVNVQVEGISAPCTPQNNKLTFSGDVLLNPVSFNSINTTSGAGAFEIRAGGSNGDLTIHFYSEAEPPTGTYTINTDCPTSFLSSNQVCMSLVYSNQWGQADSGEVYIIRLDNGKYVATFCDVKFNSSLPFELIGSAKIVEP